VSHPVLVVDDEPDSRTMLATFLEYAGYEVTTAADGREALAESHREHPCVILLDLMMPRMTGEQFRDAQRQDPELRNIPVVVVSARHDAAQTARRMSAAGFSPKPLDPDHLLSVVATYCGHDPERAHR
jgi:two-component system alkaline phosphatase synthesis response regulator PhoP